ncbi:MAG: class I SAM-dependent rRNA methyltransferase [Elusimicrobia bacterium]|nr:class I SAM-dependent rRNA methyltransferase [Elusimicrobiota bacterium]
MTDKETEAGTLKKIRLKPGREKRLLAGHDWIFSNEIMEGGGGVGDLLEVDAASGRALGVGFYNPHSLIAFRLLAREPVSVDAAFFADRLDRARAWRERLLPGAESYRLCFGESDGLPGLVVDRYGDVFVLQVYCAGMESRLELIREAMEGLFKPRGLYLKNDHRARALEGLPSECRVLCGEVPPRVEIVEGGLRFIVPLTEGQKTGFYFDQRENRAFLRPFFKGRRVLDLHCYIGAASVAAAAGGAERVMGVDSSGPAIGLARLNAAANQAAVEFREGDAQEALQAFATGPSQARPDMILLDPPSLAPSKRHLPKALKAYAHLNALALKALPRGGLLATSTCSHHVSREMFVEILRMAQSKTGKPARLLALRGQACDHPILLAMPETEYLHFALLETL